jgi:hypothetical protein
VLVVTKGLELLLWQLSGRSAQLMMVERE